MEGLSHVARNVTESPMTVHAGRGVTLIELLVGISIVGLVVVLTLCAVQAARESARRIRCTANLRQIGIAMSGYQSAYGIFAPQYPALSAGGATRPHYSAFARMLPFMEEHALFNALNFQFNHSESAWLPLLENRTVRETRLAIMLCPSDGEALRGCNYRFNCGVWMPRDAGHPRYAGPFGMFNSLRDASISDGLSNTAFLSERIAGTFRSDTELHDQTNIRDMRVPIPTITSGISGDGEYIPWCLSVGPPHYVSDAGSFWLYAGYVNTDYNHNGLPNDRRMSCGLVYGLHPPRSFHPGGVQVLSGDGHVQHVSDEIDRVTWARMGTHNRAD
jgi:prepilin-type N-terminal cleavage/methylation domain-containing protein